MNLVGKLVYGLITFVLYAIVALVAYNTGAKSTIDERDTLAIKMMASKLSRSLQYGPFTATNINGQLCLDYNYVVAEDIIINGKKGGNDAKK